MLKRFIGYKKGERDEFRYNLDTDHPNYIFEEKNGKRRGIGLTHEEYTHGKKNMPLKENPEQGDTQKAYVRYGVISGKRYSKKPKKNMSFGNEDKANVKSKVRNYKKRRKRSKKSNKKSK